MFKLNYMYIKIKIQSLKAPDDAHLSLSLSCVSMYVYIIKVLPPKCVCLFSDWKNNNTHLHCRLI